MNNKLLKKICGIFGYRLIDKKTFKNNRILAKNSSLKIQNLLNFYFSKGKINSILQIGANDGVSFDELNHFIKKFKIKSLLVEPIKENFILLEKNYQNLEFIKLENSAIVVNNELSHFILYGQSGVGKNTIIRLLAKKIYKTNNNIKKNVLILNSSDQRGINVVRNNIKLFAKKKIFLNIFPYKLIILDDCDSMTQDSQSALRRIMEIYSKY